MNHFDQLVAQLADPSGSAASIPQGVQGGRYGPSIRVPIKSRQWTEEEIALLGTLTDNQVARRIGDISYIAVQKKRRALGIPPAKPVHPPWTSEQIAMLGVLSDAELAQRTGRSSKAISQKRNQLGIPRVRREWTKDEGQRTKSNDSE